VRVVWTIGIGAGVVIKEVLVQKLASTVRAGSGDEDGLGLPDANILQLGRGCWRPME
jgi:hypothetical protein